MMEKGGSKKEWAERRFVGTGMGKDLRAPMFILGSDLPSLAYERHSSTWN